MEYGPFDIRTEGELKAAVQQGIDQMERGEYVEYDEAGLDQFFERLKFRVRARVEESSTEDSSAEDA